MSVSDSTRVPAQVDYDDAWVVIDGGVSVPCLEPRGHPSPHVAFVPVPCSDCWGMDSHAGWCPSISDTETESIDLAFTDDGTYWRLVAQEAGS